MNLLVIASSLMKIVTSLAIICMVVFSAHANSESHVEPHIVLSMPANSWLEIPNSRLDGVAADPEIYPKLQGTWGYWE